MKWCLGDPCFSLGIFLNVLRTLDIGEGSTQDILKHPLVCLKTIGTKIFLVLIMWCYPFRLFFVHSRPFLRQPRASAHMSNTLQNKRRHTIPSRVWTFIHHAGTHPTLVTGKIMENLVVSTRGGHVFLKASVTLAMITLLGWHHGIIPSTGRLYIYLQKLLIFMVLM